MGSSNRLTLRTHDYQLNKKTGRQELVELKPYISIKKQLDVEGSAVSELYIQGGKVFSQTGPAIPLEDLPDWFWEEVDKITDFALAEVKFHRKKKQTDEIKVMGRRRKE